jgi:hypothetical protein
MVTSCEEHAKRIPGLELMFKAAGHLLEAKLQTYIRNRGCRWLSVVTGPKGSYREEHVLNYLERHLPPLTEGRRWRVILMDAYGPQMSEAVRRLCWSRGYVVIIHGGGATGVTQVNDTDLHQHLRKAYLEKETAEMIRCSRLHPNGTHSPKPEQCIDWMIDVWSNPQLHLSAVAGFKKTGITNALDGSEDHLIVREAKHFWRSLRMDSQRQSAIHDVEVEVEQGRLQWTFQSIYSIIADFTAVGCLDKLLEFQDDEVVVELDSKEILWDEEIIEDEEEEQDFHGDGEEPNGLDATVALQEQPIVTLEPEIADVVIQHSARREALKQTLAIISELNCPSLELTICRITHDDERKLRQIQQTPSAVAEAMERQRLAQERAEMHEHKLVQDQLAAKRLTKAAKAEAKEYQQKLHHVRTQLKDAQDLLAAKEALKSFTPEMLGEGRSRGGGLAFKARRMEVMDRLLTHGKLTKQQNNDWNWFKETWDKHMSETHDHNWGREFAEICQGLLDQLRQGDSATVSNFMYNETRRCLSDVPMLRL